MSSPTAPDGDPPATAPAAPARRWSLERRMAASFAVTTSAIVALYAVWASYALLDAHRDDTREFIEHELDEVGMTISRTDGSVEAVAACLRDIVEVTESPVIAMRARDGGGAVIAEAGSPALLRRVPEEIRPGESWRRWFLDRNVAVGARFIGQRTRTVELVVDATKAVAAIRGFLWSAVAVFLASVVLAWMAGRWTARRGLRALAEVSLQAEAIATPEVRALIRLQDPPEEIARVADALNGMLDRIHRGLEAMRTFTATLAHELRSPIQNLVGETEVTLLADRDPDSYRRLLRSNLDDLCDLADAVDNLVAWCRTAEPAPGEAAAESFDLAAEAELRLERERRSAARAGVGLDFATSGDTRLAGDREACLRVVRNLVANAIQWSPAEECVDVRIDGGGGRVVLVVEDRGPGIPPDLRDRIFEPFVTGRPQGGRRGGYGLGLAICRAAIAAQGGSLRYEARQGGGSRFVAVFPVRDLPAAAEGGGVRALPEGART